MIRCALCLISAGIAGLLLHEPSATSVARAETIYADTVWYVTLRADSIVSRTEVWTSEDLTIVRTRSGSDAGHVTVSRIQFDEHTGAVLSLSSAGRDLRGRVVHEAFRIVGDTALWESPSENGQARRSDSSVYLPGTHARLWTILPGLLKANRWTPLLPRGRAWLEREGSFRVASAAGVETVTQYAARGLAPLVSDRIWLDRGGQVFAEGATVRLGWSDVLPALRDSAAAARARDRARHVRALRRVPHGPIAFRNIRLFDPVDRVVRDSMTVVVRDSTIVAVDHAARVSPPAGAEIVEGDGRMLLPGLWDMHSHDYGDITGEMLQLAAGVTTIRDMSRDTMTALQLRKRPVEEIAFAPYVLWAGRLANDASDAALVQRYAELGASMVKVPSYQQRRFLLPAIAEAKRLGLRVTGHLGAGISVEDAVNVGYDEISHIPHLTVNISTESDYVGAPQYLWRGVQNAAGMKMDSDAVRRTIQILRARGLAIDPTLAFVEPSVNVRGLLVRAYIVPVLDWLPGGFGRGYIGWTMVEPAGMSLVAAAGFSNLKLLVKDLHKAGVPLLPGTDDIAGFTLRRELELYVEAGIPAADVLYLATLGAARVMNMHSAVGSIEVGKRADMILIDGDPLARITDLGRVVLTVKSGAIYEPARLYGELGFMPSPQFSGLTKQ